MVVPLSLVAFFVACSPSVPNVGDASITCNGDGDCLPGEICDTTDSPHYCFAAPPDGGDAGADAGDAGGQDAGDAGDGGGTPADGGMDAGCVIAGQFYAPDAPNPDFACAKCVPALSTSDWSSATDDTACGNDGGNYCFVGACVSGCLIDGGLVFAGANFPGNGCQVCDPDAGSTSYTNLPELTACTDAGNFCHAGQCDYGCGIDGGFVAGWTAKDAVVSGCCNPLVSATNWTPAFAAAREVTLTAHPSGLTVNDFNGDGLSDFAATQADNTVDVYLAQADGGYAAQQPIDFSPGSAALVAAPFSSGGPVDLALLEAGAPALQIFHGNGDGTFVDAGTLDLTLLSSLNGILAPLLVSAPDVLLSGNLSGAPGIDIFSNELGQFSGGHSSFVFTQGTSPWALASGMFRSDAGPDIAVMNNDGSGIDILVNNSGTLKESELAPSVGVPQAIATAELNSDRLDDFVVLSTQLGDAGVAQSYFSLGDGGFALGPATLIDPKPVALASFLRSGAPTSTLAIADGKNGSVSVMTALDGGLFSSGTYSAGTSANAISTGDFNGDGLTDLVVSDPSSSVYILYGQCR